MKEKDFQKILSDIKEQLIQEEYLRVEARHEQGYMLSPEDLRMEISGQYVEKIDINDERVIQLVEALKYNPFITKLSLRFSQISDVGAISLSQLKQLKELYLSHNKINIKGATALANIQLEKLYLGYNCVYFSQNMYETHSFIDAIINNQTIKFLSLNSCLNDNKNKLKDQLIDKLIRENKTLTYLKLKGNCLSDMCLSSIHLNTTIKELDIRDNYITDIGITYLLSNNSLKSVDLKDNQITFQGMQLFYGSSFESVWASYPRQSDDEKEEFYSNFDKSKQKSK